jgi:Raf kinase inhibitor-like YbhB/YbcL family protein
MKKYLILILIVVIGGVGVLLYFITSNHNITSTMQIASPAFKDQEYIPQEFTCSGENANPPLFISDYPEQTKSFALIVEDPDAPNGTWIHWVMWNIPTVSLQQNTDEKIVTVIQRGIIPQGAMQGATSFGKTEYGGPCPPPGKPHHYIFRVYALDVPALTTFSASTTAQQLEAGIQDHVLEKAELVGLYAR